MADKLAYGIREAAALLSLSPWTVWRMVTNGRLPVIRFNRRVLIAPEAIQHLIERGQKTPWAPTPKR